MKVRKILTMGLGLIATIVITLVALADDQPLVVKVGSIQDMTQISLYLVNADDNTVIQDKWAITSSSTVQFDKRDESHGDTKLEVIYNSKRWSCKTDAGEEEIPVTVQEVSLDNISEANKTCLLTLPETPFVTLTMNYYVYGLENDVEEIFYVRQFSGSGEIEDVEQKYSFGNTWPSKEQQEMSIDYLYGEIWRNGEACEFSSGENPSRIGIDISEIHVKYDATKGNNCVLSLEPFPLPIEYVKLELNVNISGVHDIYYTPMVLIFESKSSEGVLRSAGFFEYDCERYNGCMCSDGKTKPVNGFCVEEFNSTNLGDETIELVWRRIKEGFIVQKGVCKLDGSALLPQYDIVYSYDVYGSDPTQEVVCEIKPKQ